MKIKIWKNRWSE